MRSQGGFGFVQVVLVIALLIGGFGGWSFYQKQLAKKEAAFVATQVRDATDRVRQQVGFFKTPRGETYAEAIAAADTNVKAIDSAIALLRHVESPHSPAVVKHGIEYLEASQNSLRSLRNMVRAKAEFTVAKDAAKNALADMETYVADPASDSNKFHSDVARYSAGPIQKRLASANESLDGAVQSTGRALSAQVTIASQRPPVISSENYLSAEEVNGITFSL